MRAGADLRNPSLVNGWRRMSWVARYWCSSLAVTKPDLTPSRLRAIKSLSAFLFLVDNVWVCQLEIAKIMKEREITEEIYNEIKQDLIQHTKFLWWDGFQGAASFSNQYFHHVFLKNIKRRYIYLRSKAAEDTKTWFQTIYLKLNAIKCKRKTRKSICQQG